MLRCCQVDDPRESIQTVILTQRVRMCDTYCRLSCKRLDILNRTGKWIVGAIVSQCYDAITNAPTADALHYPLPTQLPTRVGSFTRERRAPLTLAPSPSPELSTPQQSSAKQSKSNTDADRGNPAAALNIRRRMQCCILGLPLAHSH